MYTLKCAIKENNDLMRDLYHNDKLSFVQLVIAYLLGAVNALGLLIAIIFH